MPQFKIHGFRSNLVLEAMLKMPDEFIHKGRPTNYIFLTISFPPSPPLLSHTQMHTLYRHVIMCVSFQTTDRLKQVTDCHRNWHNHHANIGALHLRILEFPIINYANMVTERTRMAKATLDPLVAH
jgi:hypothetical protein